MHVFWETRVKAFYLTLFHPFGLLKQNAIKCNRNILLTLWRLGGPKPLCPQKWHLMTSIAVPSCSILPGGIDKGTPGPHEKSTTSISWGLCGHDTLISQSPPLLIPSSQGLGFGVCFGGAVFSPQHTSFAGLRKGFLKVRRPKARHACEGNAGSQWPSDVVSVCWLLCTLNMLLFPVSFTKPRIRDEQELATGFVTHTMC